MVFVGAGHPAGPFSGPQFCGMSDITRKIEKCGRGGSKTRPWVDGDTTLYRSTSSLFTITYYLKKLPGVLGTPGS